MLFADFAKDYLELESKPFKSSWKDDQRRLIRLSVQFEGKRLDEITTLDVLRLRNALNNRPFESNRVIDTLHRLYEIAKQWNIYSGTNPADGVRRHREEPREKFVTKDQLPILWSAIEKLDHDYAPAYFKLLLLTGLRRNTLRRLEWSNVSFSDSLIHVPKAIDKMRKSQELHLNELAVEVLKGIRRKEPYLFWSRAGNQWGDPNGGLMSDSQVGHYWEKIKAYSGLDLRIHDLRRTAGSYLAQEGVNTELIGKLLNHIPGSSATAIYTRFVDQNQRDAMELHGKIIRSKIQ